MQYISEAIWDRGVFKTCIFYIIKFSRLNTEYSKYSSTQKQSDPNIFRLYFKMGFISYPNSTKNKKKKSSLGKCLYINSLTHSPDCLTQFGTCFHIWF